MGIHMVKGRSFNESDRAGAPNALLITETAARQFFSGEDPIGKQITVGWNFKDKNYESTVVGIVSDVKQSSLAKATLPQFYIAYDQRPVSSFVVVLHGARDPLGMQTDVRRVVRELDPDLAVTKFSTLENVMSDSVAKPRFYMLLLSAFAVVALMLSTIGIYGVIAYLVGQRSREIGIRIALGATPMRVVRLVIREGVLMTVLGLAVGLAGALAVSRLMGALLFNVEATDVITYVSVTTMLALVALAASFIPALRASHVDPVVALRAEG
jgi:putative ABC transport system permease protein